MLFVVLKQEFLIMIILHSVGTGNTPDIMDSAR